MQCTYDHEAVAQCFAASAGGGASGFFNNVPAPYALGAAANCLDASVANVPGVRRVERRARAGLPFFLHARRQQPNTPPRKNPSLATTTTTTTSRRAAARAVPRCGVALLRDAGTAGARDRRDAKQRRRLLGGGVHARRRRRAAVSLPRRDNLALLPHGCVGCLCVRGLCVRCHGDAKGICPQTHFPRVQTKNTN